VLEAVAWVLSAAFLNYSRPPTDEGRQSNPTPIQASPLNSLSNAKGIPVKSEYLNSGKTSTFQPYLAPRMTEMKKGRRMYQEPCPESSVRRS
jgi:hypothetical protein